MSGYIPMEDSIYSKLGGNVRRVLETIANQYMAAAPPHGFTFRTISGESFRQLEDGRYDLSLLNKYPDRAFGEFGYACCLIRGEEDESIELSLSCYGPTRIYLNGKPLYRSVVDDDVNVANRRLLQAKLRKGWNVLFVKMIKTASGFGCILGSSNYKWFPLHSLSPFAERKGSGGWVYASSPTDLYPEQALPAAFASEAEQPVAWYPELIESNALDFKGVFGECPGDNAYAWSTFFTSANHTSCKIKGSSSAALQIWIDRVPVLHSEGGPFEADLQLHPGEHSVLIRSACGGADWKAEFSVSHEEIDSLLSAPQAVKGVRGAWLYLGPFRDSDIERVEAAPIDTLYRLFDSSATEDGRTYWRSTGFPDGYVRPYLENDRHARWNYPLGVTLYGLLQTARILERQDMRDYVVGHMNECVSLYPYSLWDRDRYGAPAINHQLVELNMLDDCGSFGSAMLETYEDTKDERYLRIAHIIADYIMNKQERQPDGAFYRLREGEYQERTLWADDLYMSTPFLIRYYKQTGSAAALNDAAKQFLLFRNYLYMPEQQLMSHVYDFKYNTATYVPWGRGNGWVLFSLSELLAVLPESHGDRKSLIGFFNELAEGYAKVQGERGLWHQVLTDSSSYEEASCTAMFAYAFSRGVRYGWLEDASTYADASVKAWRGLTQLAIDGSGNVYGVCRGSGYSFTAEYYRDELNWLLNDTHGIGIVLLCGAEYEKLLTSIQPHPTSV